MARRTGSDRKNDNRTGVWIGPLVFFLILFLRIDGVRAQTPTLSIATLTVTPTQLYIVTKEDLISWVNQARSKLGYRELRADPYLMLSAQDSAAVMAEQMIGHIGGVSERVPLYGYNNGLEVFATENYMTGPATMAAIAAGWGDPSHQRIVENPLYCHIGVGIAEAADGTVYYVVQGAYPAFKNGCDYMKPPPGSASATYYPGMTPNSAFSPPVSSVPQVIASVRIATPNAEGRTIHVVKNGQSLWSIAAAYGVDFDDLVRWNRLSESSKLSLDQELIIPDAETLARELPPTAIPTVLATMSADGKFRHVIQPGETLWEIAELWKTDLESLKRINGLTDDMALGVGWKLFIPVTPTVTLPPTLTPTITATADRDATIAAMVETASALTQPVAPTVDSPKETAPLHSARPIGVTLLLVGLGVALTVGAALIGYGLKRRN